MRRQRGFALLVVMGTLGLLALLAAHITGAGRTEAQVSGNLRAGAMVEAAADGVVEEAVLRLMQRRWQADGQTYATQVGAARVLVRIFNQDGKINPNETTIATLQALLNNVGVDPAEAASLAMAIVDWRTRVSTSLLGGTKLAQYRSAGLPYGPANRPFNSVDEIGLVVGMTPAVLAKIRPYLSVYHEGNVLQAAGSDTVASALAEAKVMDPNAPRFGFESRNIVVQIDATATTNDGGRFTREAIVRIKTQPEAEEMPYQILTWDVPDD